MIEVEFTDDMSAYKLPAGSSGTTVVYAGGAHLVKVVRMVLLRVKTREKYLFSA